MRALTVLVRVSMLAVMLSAALPSARPACACDRDASTARADACTQRGTPLPGATSLSDACCRYAPMDFTTAPAEMTHRPESGPLGKALAAAITRAAHAAEAHAAHAPAAKESGATGPPGFFISEILRL